MTGFYIQERLTEIQSHVSNYPIWHHHCIVQKKAQPTLATALCNSLAERESAEELKAAMCMYISLGSQLSQRMM